MIAEPPVEGVRVDVPCIVANERLQPTKGIVVRLHENGADGKCPALRLPSASRLAERPEADGRRGVLERLPLRPPRSGEAVDVPDLPHRGAELDSPARQVLLEHAVLQQRLFSALVEIGIHGSPPSDVGYFVAPSSVTTLH